MSVCVLSERGLVLRHRVSLRLLLVVSSYRLGLPDREDIVIQQNLLDAWEVQFHSPKQREAMSLGTAGDLPEAIRRAEAFVQKQRAAALRLLDLSARWRNQPLSEAQRGLLGRKGIPIPKGLTRGQASWMIGLLSAHGRA